LESRGVREGLREKIGILGGHLGGGVLQPLGRALGGEKGFKSERWRNDKALA